MQGVKKAQDKPRSSDVPLKSRIDKAIAQRVKLLMSFHADANDNPSAKGHWAFYWYSCPESKRLAEIWSKYAKTILPNNSRGIVGCKPNFWANFYMCREPVINPTYKFPSILMEHGFMTNLQDSALLKSDIFRRDCARVAISTACEFFDRQLKPMKEAEEVDKCKVYLDGALIGEGLLYEQRVYLPVRVLENKRYVVERWDGGTMTVYLNFKSESNFSN
ncbi:MAG: N-acetylmuramoyl-L-alanine amidase [Bacillota bacterium]